MTVKPLVILNAFVVVIRTKISPTLIVLTIDVLKAAFTILVLLVNCFVRHCIKQGYL